MPSRIFGKIDTSGVPEARIAPTTLSGSFSKDIFNAIGAFPAKKRAFFGYY